MYDIHVGHHRRDVRYYTDAEDQLILEMDQRGATYAGMQAEMPLRSIGGIRSRYHTLKVSEVSIADPSSREP